MPFYTTDESHTFPPRPQRSQDVSDKRREYVYMDKKELIALCDERGITIIHRGKSVPVGRYQKKAYYIERLTQWDAQQPRMIES